MSESQEKQLFALLQIARKLREAMHQAPTIDEKLRLWYEMRGTDRAAKKLFKQLQGK